MGDDVEQEEHAEVKSEGPEVLSTGLKLSLTPEVVGEVWGLAGDHEAQSKTVSRLSLPGLSDPHAFRAQVVSDFYLFNLVHAKSLGLLPRQAAVFHAIMEEVFLCIGPDQDMESDACFERFRTLLLAHSIDRPPEHLAVFKGNEARLLSDFVTSTFFKHILLYKYCLSCQREVESMRLNISVDAPIPPPDLSSARQVRTSRKSSAAVAGEKPDEAAADGDEQDKPELDEELEEVEAIVRAKLEETRKALEAKLDEREELFKQNLAKLEESSPKSKKK